jgi:hypothetical protein
VISYYRARPHAGSTYGRPDLRFWKKIDKNGPLHPRYGKCWVWTGNKFTSGYGQIWAIDGPKRAHRFSYELNCGVIPEGILVLHKCDNRVCVRPSHLFLGTCADNSEDMRIKGRSAKGLNHGSVTHPEAVRRGEKHGMAKLTIAQVKEIRRLYIKGHPEYGGPSLAVRFGVSPVMIRNIANHKNWI